MITGHTMFKKIDKKTVTIDRTEVIAPKGKLLGIMAVQILLPCMYGYSANKLSYFDIANLNKFKFNFK